MLVLGTPILGQTFYHAVYDEWEFEFEGDGECSIVEDGMRARYGRCLVVDGSYMDFDTGDRFRLCSFGRRMVLVECTEGLMQRPVVFLAISVAVVEYLAICAFLLRAWALIALAAIAF